VVEALSDEDVERLMMEQGGNADEVDIVSGDGLSSIEVPVMPVDHEEDELFHMGRIDKIFNLFDPENDRVNEELNSKAVDSDGFLDTDNASLAKLFLQALWEDASADYESALQLVLLVVNEFGSEKAANQVDEDISRYVDKAIVATSSEDAPLGKAADVLRGGMNGSLWYRERLSDFLERLVPASKLATEVIPSSSADASKKYLSINPVITELFSRLKQRVILRQRKSEL
jgi:hypothetical protein